jgi:hypothetical protein
MRRTGGAIGPPSRARPAAPKRRRTGAPPPPPPPARLHTRTAMDTRTPRMETLPLVTAASPESTPTRVLVSISAVVEAYKMS